MSASGTGLPDFEGVAFFTQSGAAAAATKNIWVAAADGEVDTVRAHLDAGVDPNARDDNGYTALHAAASYGHVSVLEMLVSRGASVSVTDEDGDTPLHAAESGDVIRWLIAHGADPNATNDENMTPLDSAKDDGNAELAAVWHAVLGLGPLADGDVKVRPDVQLSMEQVRDIAAREQGELDEEEDGDDDEDT